LLQDLEIFVGSHRGLPKPASASLRSNDHRCVVEIVLELDEVIGMKDFEVVDVRYIGREIAKVERDDRVGARMNRCR